LAAVRQGPPWVFGRSRRGTGGPTAKRFLRIICDRCGKLQIINEAHAAWRDRTLRQILARMRHDGCGGLAGRAELVTDSEAVSSRPVRKIVLRE
jgi:hypothetical protein